MTPKCSQTSSSYDTDRFVSAVASNRYEHSLLKKVPIGEQGFNIQEGHFPNLIALYANECGPNFANNHKLSSSSKC